MPVIATAGWSIPKTVAERFPSEGTSLERYAAVFPGVEINSTFYRSHLPSTYEKWAASVGDDFRFSLKLPKTITHERRLAGIADLFAAFLEETALLGQKRGPLLCQLPFSLRFDASLVRTAFAAMRERYDGMIVIEPRHRTWAEPTAYRVLQDHGVERVFADPAPVWSKESFQVSPAYIRLHGSPEIYYSRYTPEEIAAYRAIIGPESWCVFDNTASGAAIVNALEMAGLGEF